MKLCVVIAAYNERENIETLTRRLDTALRGLTDWQTEILYVIDGTDGTKEIVERLANEIPNLRFLHSEKPSGLGAAFRRGFAAIPPDVDYVVTMDADLNHQPEEIPRLLEAAIALKTDIVVGSRFVAGSSVQGIPVWKKSLSGVMNVAMRHLYGLNVLDKTSGFRVYRAEALRRLQFRNDDFAFLPEILVMASRGGMTIAEEPIRFVYRVAGRSKMHIGTTVLSYLSLLSTALTPARILAVLLILLGGAIRALWAFPTHRFPAEADCILEGLKAFRIREGHFPVFYAGVRNGAFEAYLHAIAFALFGVSRASLSLAPLVAGIGTLIAGALLFRELLPPREALLALAFLAVPSPAFLLWTYMPNGYGQTIFFCVMALWLSARLSRTGEAGPWAFAFGLAVGLGWWSSFLSFGATVPAVVWLVARKPRVVFAPRFLLPAVGAFLIGALPWMAYNIRYPLASFHGNFGARPVASLHDARENLRYVIHHDLAETALDSDPVGGETQPPWNPVGRTLFWMAALIDLSSLAFFGLWLVWRIARPGGPNATFPSVLLVLFVAFATISFFVFSEAGHFRGLTARYLFPAYIVLPVCLARFLGYLSRRRKALALFMGCAVAAYSLMGYYWPWSSRGLESRKWAAEDAARLRILENSGIRYVCGDYWLTYPINFLSRERILGIPTQAGFDYYRYDNRLGPTPARCALIGADDAKLSATATMAGIAGDVIPTAGNEFLLFPSVNPPASGSPTEVVSRIRDATNRAVR